MWYYILGILFLFVVSYCAQLGRLLSDTPIVKKITRIESIEELCFLSVMIIITVLVLYANWD